MSEDVSPLQPGVGPADSEIEAWAVREHYRHEQWAGWPTPEQTALWRVRERERRKFEQQRRLGSPARQMAGGGIPRELRSAAIGAIRLVVTTSMKDLVDRLVVAGLEWEEEMSSRRCTPGR